MATINKLSAMPYANAWVWVDDRDNIITLYSYQTPVAQIRDNWLEIYGLYSMTTRKHIGAFMKEYVIYPNGTTGTYQDAKKLYEHNWRFNIETGEIEELS